MKRQQFQTMYATVREYLLELDASGVEGVPLEDGGNDQTPAVQRAPHTLDTVRQQLGDCQRCPLAATRTNLVFGAGSETARLVFVGEGPGADEDRQGQPFVGEAGQVLTRLIEAMQLTREQVYICNVVKCRPPANRNPHKDEIAACFPFLIQQLQVIKPEVIVALGTFAAQTLLGCKEPISRLRGTFRQYQGIPLMPTFHPAFLLRNRDTKQHYWDVWSDMMQVLHLLKLPVPEKKKRD